MVVSHFKESIFATISKKANEYQAINLAQGFPNFDGPEWVKTFVTDAIKNGENQYPPFLGILSLRKSISDYYQKYYNLSFDPNHEILVTSGATEAIFISILALVNPGDEVILFEPFYDSYVPAIELAGGKPIYVTLKGPQFNFSETELTKAFSAKTKLILLNTPHNPSGKIFSKEELTIIAELAKKFDSYIIADEVYEFLTFDNHRHIPIATLAEVKERTITISSAGKTFGFTGWKIGWIVTTKALITVIGALHQYNVFSVSTPMQSGVAKALTKLENYLPEFQTLYTEKRDRLFSALTKMGFKPIKPSGTYFILCSIDHLTQLDNVSFAHHLIESAGVATIPTLSFYFDPVEGKKYIRFCFAKTDETLNEAIHRLAKFVV